MKRIAVINRFASEYTVATYFLEAFQELGIPYATFHPDRQKNISMDYSIRFYIDDGSHYCIYPDPNVVKVLYIIDTHTRFDLDMHFCRFADMVFCAQHNAVNMIKPLCQNVFWLPLGCSPKWHFCRSCEKKYDVAFIGASNNDPKREQYLRVLREKFGGRCFVGRASKNEIGKIYSSAKIVFNVSYNNDINMRFFEGLASGALLLTEKITDNGMSELLNGEGDKICVFYETLEEALSLIDYYLTHEEERHKIASLGKKFSESHTYTQRVNLALTLVEKTHACPAPPSNLLAYHFRTAQLALQEGGIQALARRYLGVMKRNIFG